MDRVEVGAAAREDRAAALDRLLADLFAASGARVPGVALVATGGLGRRECAPCGDLDLMLVHTGLEVTAVADRIWYPIWDAKLALDHSVRTLPETLSVAIDDVRVALALLDVRHVAGDERLAAELRRAGLDQWRRTAGRGVVRLRAAVAERHERHGDLAFLLEGDLKESRGGLRDLQVLAAIGTLGITDALRPAVRAAHRGLLDARDAVHATVGRRVDRVRAQDREVVAKHLDLRDGDEVLRRVSTDARTVAHALDDAWRAVDRWLAAGQRSRTSRPVRVPVARDVVAHEGEVVLARKAVGAHPDPSLSLRVAAASATSGLPIARGTLEWLARFAPPMPTPWPADARRAFVTLLGSGPALLPVWEACDRFGLVGGWLPEWNRLRGLPQHHPIHVYTVDRHSVQAVVEAAPSVRRVARPDLLLVGALLHDVGKGRPGDHCEVGAPIAAGVAAALGFRPADARTIASLVRHHLLLPHVATRRDIADPATLDAVAAAVGDVATLELLHALCLADAAAAGPQATSAWKTRLIGELVSRVRVLLVDGVAPQPPPDRPAPDGPLPAVEVTEGEVTVAALDRRGLLASVAGVVALHKLDVLGADTWTAADRAVVRLRVTPRYGAPADRTRLIQELRQAAVGGLAADRAARLARGPAGRDRPTATPRTTTRPTVTWHSDATDAVVLELRAADAPGLLFRVTRALELAGADVRAARAETLGGDAVDAFYLSGDWADPDRRERVGAVVLAAAGPGS